MRKNTRLLIFFLTAIASFALLIPKMDVVLTKDWAYFDSLSLVIKSSFLHYNTFPLQNPWTCGGLDILRNPQNRIFSPFIILDLLFYPNLANIFTLIILAFFGLLGMYKALRQLGKTEWVAITGAIVFINGSWFGLHFYEGHIAYGSFQLLPWIVYFALRIHERKYQIGMALLFSFFLLDGGIYTFVFGLYLLISLFLFKIASLKQLIKTIQTQWQALLVILIAALLLTLPKTLPGILNSRSQALTEFSTLPFNFIWELLFSPFRSETYNTDFRFHEYGCYLSIVGVCLIANTFYKRESLNEKLKYLILALFWFWVGSGLIPAINPWKLHVLIPFFNFAHVQSRVFILTFFFFVLLLCSALEDIRKYKKVYIILTIFFIAESFLIHNYEFYKAYTKYPRDRAPVDMITSTNVNGTYLYTDLVSHYYSGWSTKHCYEPSLNEPGTVDAYAHNYKGEIYIAEDKKGKVTLDSYTPGSIKFSYKLDAPTQISLNTRSLHGWRMVSGEGTLHTDQPILKFDPQGKEGAVELEYAPSYFWAVLLSFFAGIGLFVQAWIGRNSKKKI